MLIWKSFFQWEDIELELNCVAGGSIMLWLARQFQIFDALASYCWTSLHFLTVPNWTHDAMHTYPLKVNVWQMRENWRHNCGHFRWHRQDDHNVAVGVLGGGGLKVMTSSMTFRQWVLAQHGIYWLKWFAFEYRFLSLLCGEFLVPPCSP